MQKVGDAKVKPIWLLAINENVNVCLTLRLIIYLSRALTFQKKFYSRH